MSLSAALRWRYATKKFDPDKRVSEAIVDTLLDAANLTATSYGLQPFKFIVIQNQELQDSLVAASYGQRQVADASHVIVIATRTDVDQDFVAQYTTLVEQQRGLPEGAMDSYRDGMVGTLARFSERDRMEWAARQAYLALGTLLTVCADLEIDSCPMEGFVAEEYNDLLDLSARNLHAAVVLPVGYRAGDDATQHQVKVRKPIKEMIIRI